MGSGASANAFGGAADLTNEEKVIITKVNNLDHFKFMILIS